MMIQNTPGTGRPQTGAVVLRTDVTLAAVWRLDRVVDLVVAPLDRERVGEMLREGLNAEPLGRMVTRGDQVDAEFLRGREAILAKGSFGYSPVPGTTPIYN